VALGAKIEFPHTVFREGKSWTRLLRWESTSQRTLSASTASTRRGRSCSRKAVSRARLLELVAHLPPCLIGLEACSGAHEWARRFQPFGHTVKIMAPKFVVPYRRSGKNDGNDAEAICEAVQRPSMRFVPVKSVEQQAILSMHRVRQGFVEERTATINRVRGLMSEFGVVLPARAVEVKRGARSAAAQLPALARAAIEDLLDHLATLDQRIAGYDRELESQARSSEAARRSMTVPGCGAPQRAGDGRSPWGMRMNSRMADSSRPGWGSSRANGPPEASRAWAASPSAETPTCERC
jgi:transposase